MLRIGVGIRLDLAGGERIDHVTIAILETIRETGSITAAARRAGVSYRRAWLLVRRINAMLVEPAVARRVGGARGGGASLTEAGEQVVSLYRSIEVQANM